MFVNECFPYSGLSAATITSILNKAINLVGLQGGGFSAKSFRSMGVTAAVEGAILPDSVRSVGRWKNRACFEEHYVHSKPNRESDVILLS